MDEFPVVEVPTDKVLEEEEFEQLYSASTGIIALLSIFYGTISFLAVIGNSLVIWVVLTTRHMHTVTNMYIANLAIADVVIGLFCIPFQEKFKREFNKRFSACFCKFRTNLTAHERTLSMHTRATSIRSNFANSSMRIRNNLYAEAAAGGGGGGGGGGGCGNIYYTYRYANLRKDRSNGNNDTYNMITYTIENGGTVRLNECNSNNNGMAAGRNTGSGCTDVPQWRRNNFRPLYPDVIECDDDLDTLMQSTPTSEEPNSSSRGSNGAGGVTGGPGFALTTKGKR
ncbi:uncharacterized protein LOC118746381 [Rhagoletis pomonella]|uniref:uncharacterized protein LOC118746381 n=1 Tax=Rhagoletis pomonella TaxID=28610 RepID=UPI0017848A9F|nr:uncharacterized protein LOC118746381 [Rhagoletis pomonella]